MATTQNSIPRENIMSKKLEDILNEALAPEIKAQLQEAFDEKIEAMRTQVQEAAEADLANRYEHDKAQLVEAMDAMLKDVAKLHEEKKMAEIVKLQEARRNLAESNKSAKQAIRKQISEMADRSGEVINSALQKEISSLRAEKDAAIASAEKLAEGVASVKAKLVENHKDHLAKINEFVINSVTKELSEFDQDKKDLVETRVRLIAESKDKIADMQARFIKESASKVDKMVKSSLKSELSQLREDLEVHRQNMFGRKIFEAMAAEFQSSYLAEGTEVRKMQNLMKAKQAEMDKVIAEAAATKKKLDESLQQKAAAERKIALAESRAERTQIMSELMSNLKSDKRAVMESMLETTKTSALRSAFQKFLPVVLAEGQGKKVAPTGKNTVLRESRKPTISTGNRSVRIDEQKSQQEEQKNDEIATILHLAGIRK